MKLRKLFLIALVGALFFATHFMVQKETKTVLIRGLTLVRESVTKEVRVDRNLACVVSGNFPNSIISGNFPNSVVSGNFPNSIVEGNFPSVTTLSVSQTNSRELPQPRVPPASL
jgi:hypothetical protein